MNQAMNIVGKLQDLHAWMSDLRNSGFQNAIAVYRVDKGLPAACNLDRDCSWTQASKYESLLRYQCHREVLVFASKGILNTAALLHKNPLGCMLGIASKSRLLESDDVLCGKVAAMPRAGDLRIMNLPMSSLRTKWQSSKKHPGVRKG
eukprot:6119943-Amphidinium_carterae.2